MPYTWTDLSWLTSNWFWRGTQSAIFYYISCAPCSKIAYRRKRKKESRKAEAEKEKEGEGYKHILPSSTNPYWNEEIALGPGPPPKRSNKERDKGRLKERDLESGCLNSNVGTVSGSDGTGRPELPLDLEHTEAGWNKKRYHREDELLWGRDDDSKISLESSPLSRSGSSRGTYYSARNPAVNDLHPPVVSSQPTSRNETLWMLQPPPKAKIMEGKERRSRSSSGTTNVSRESSKRGGGMILGRQAGGNLMVPKVSYGHQTPDPTPLSRGPSNRSVALPSSSTTSTSIQGQRHDRDAAILVAPLTDASENPEPHLLQTPAPPSAFRSEASLPSPLPDRPPLSTVPSSSLPQKPKDRPPHLRPVVLSANSVSSLHILQELIPPSNQLNSKIQPLDGAVGVKLPPASAQEDQELGLPEVDSRFPENGWNFPQSRQRQSGTRGKRWSMEL